MIVRLCIGVRRKCRPEAVVRILYFIELATAEFQSDPSLYGKLVDVAEAHRAGRYVRTHPLGGACTASSYLMSPSFVSSELRKTLIDIAHICPRSLDLLSYMTVFLPQGWCISVKVNPAKQNQYDAFAIVAPGPTFIRLAQLDPPVAPVSVSLDWIVLAMVQLTHPPE